MRRTIQASSSVLIIDSLKGDPALISPPSGVRFDPPRKGFGAMFSRSFVCFGTMVGSSSRSRVFYTLRAVNGGHLCSRSWRLQFSLPEQVNVARYIYFFSLSLFPIFLLFSVCVIYIFFSPYFSSSLFPQKSKETRFLRLIIVTFCAI